MSYISSFLTAFCACSVAIGALYMLCPEGATEKSVKYILSLVFLLTVTASAGITVKKADIKLDFSVQTENDATALELKNAEYVYAYALNKSGIEFSKIEIFTDKDENGGISINKVLIHSNAEFTEITEALAEAAKNIEVEVIDD